MAVSLTSEKVLERWAGLVQGGAGRSEWLIDKTIELLSATDLQNLFYKREPVRTGMFSDPRDFLILTYGTLREYAMFIGARDFGKDLDVAWFLTVNPGFLKRAISKKLTGGNPNALSMDIDLFAQQDLQAFKLVADTCLQKAVDILLDELKLDHSTIDRKSKGFLSVW